MAVKKQAALSQLIFTVSTAAVTLLVLPLLTWFVLVFLGFDENLVLGLALFHSVFNIIGVILFYPFIGKLAGFAEGRIREEEKEFSKHIHKTDPAVFEAGIEAFRKEIARQLRYSLIFIANVLHPSKHAKKITYDDLLRYHAEIFEYYSSLVSHQLEKEEATEADRLLRASRNIMNASKNLNDVKVELAALASEINPFHQKLNRSLEERLKKLQDTGSLLSSGPESRDPELTRHVEQLQQVIEEEDKAFIKMCGESVSTREVKKVEITYLLMLNRLVTQSGRMLLFSMKTLIELPGEKPVVKGG